MRAPTFLLLFASVLCSACGDLTPIEFAKLSFKAPVDSNIVLTEAEEDTRDIMAFDVGNLVINTPNSAIWGAPNNHKFVGLASTVLHQRRENDLFPAGGVGRRKQPDQHHLRQQHHEIVFAGIRPCRDDALSTGAPRVSEQAVPALVSKPRTEDW